MEPERTPDAMMTHTVKGTTYVVASFFNQNSDETAADKMARVIEREAAMNAGIYYFSAVNCFTRRQRCGIIRA